MDRMEQREQDRKQSFKPAFNYETFLTSRRQGLLCLFFSFFLPLFIHLLSLCLLFPFSVSRLFRSLCPFSSLSSAFSVCSLYLLLSDFFNRQKQSRRDVLRVVRRAIDQDGDVDVSPRFASPSLFLSRARPYSSIFSFASLSISDTTIVVLRASFRSI